MRNYWKGESGKAEEEEHTLGHTKNMKNSAVGEEGVGWKELGDMM